MFCLHVYLMMPGALRGHKRKLDSLVLELHMVGWRATMCVLGSEPGSFAGAASVFSC